MKRHSKRFVRLYLTLCFFKFKMEVFLAKPQGQKSTFKHTKTARLKEFVRFISDT